MNDEFEVKIEDLQDGSHALVDVKCDNCGEILENIIWQNYKKCLRGDDKYYCNKCAKKLYGDEKMIKTRFKNSISFYQWCYDNLPKEEADIILDRWDYKLNIDIHGTVISPEDVSYGSKGFNRKGYWFKCLDHPEHGSELKSIANFTSNVGSIKCTKCKKVAITHPHLVNYLVNKEDSYKYSAHSNVKIPMRCPDCGHKKKRSMCELSSQGFACECCGDGKSYSNKFLFNFLKQLCNLNIINDFGIEKKFDWLIYEFKNKLRKGSLDGYFEINGNKYGIEMDGGWHKKDNNMSGQTKEESQYIDSEKDKICRKNFVEIIRIDCIKSEWQYIKNGIMDELSSILNFKESDINWLKCHEAGLSNLVKNCCELWNSGIKSKLKIGFELKLHNSTISRYLKQGSFLGWV